VSSPIRRKPRRQVVREASDESDQYEDVEDTSNGYALDEFVVNDEEPDYANSAIDNGPLTPVHRQPRSNGSGGVSLESLSPNLRAMVEGIISTSQLQCRNIMTSKSLRNQPFSDTVLQEIALRRPKNKDEMLAIPGINPIMVNLYGDVFLRIVSNSISLYSQIKGVVEPSFAKEGSQPLRRDLRGGRLQSLKPFDPNHQEIITIDDESEYSDGEASIEQSRYFSQQPSEDVAKYNSYFNQSQGRIATSSGFGGNRTSYQSSAKVAPKRTTKEPAKKIDFSRFAANLEKQNPRKKDAKGSSSSTKRGIGMMPI
jgi:bloom syndrome protein